jgi:NAD(P)-dependent dehydrogenase (short-subunit alcohol dehydrogenase family)
MTLEGKVALVTGASRGIGAAVAHMLDERGVKLGLASRSGADLGLDAVAQPCDVRVLEQLESIVAATVERFGRLDILVANAGVGAYGPFLDLSREHLDEMIDVNLRGTLYAVRAALPHLSSPARPTSSRWPPRRAGAVFPSKPSTVRRSSARSGSRARSTTSCASTASAARTSARAASRPTSRSTMVAAVRLKRSRG